jgi:hypothetical protein
VSRCKKLKKYKQETKNNKIMFGIIESYRHHFKKEERDANTKKLHALLDTFIKNKITIPVFELFHLINKLFDFTIDMFELYETVGPALELKFGDKLCCSYRWGVDRLPDGTYIPKRCIGQKQVGFLYCTKHNEIETKICKGCKYDLKKDVIHKYGWEHFGNIFEKNLKQNFTKNINVFKIGNNPLHTYPVKYLAAGNVIEPLIVSIPSLPKVEPQPHPKVEPTSLKPTHIPVSKQQPKPKLLSGMISSISEPEIKLTDENKTQMMLLLTQFMIENNLIKVNKAYPIKDIYVYDDDTQYFEDGKYVFTMNRYKMKVVGIYKDSDSIILKKHIDDVCDNFKDFNNNEINSFCAQFT